ncbi:MAG: RNA repair transcriptional activator RtcR [Nitrospinota bacterium]|nr:RNA repair transcriptional activator RtcR [Nitrospinota bacterium]
MKTTVIGLLGTTLDSGFAEKRWERWRPTVGMFMHQDLLIHRMELIIPSDSRRLASTVAMDIQSVSPETTVNIHPIDFADPWDFEEVYAGLADFCARYPFDQEKEEYLVHITTGTHVAQICLFLLTESRRLPGKLIQTGPDRRDPADPAGVYSIIDLDLSKYDRLAARFAQEASDDVSYLKSGIETKNVEFNQLIERIENVAVNTKDPILLTGPTGAGKSRLARRIFDLKKARRQMTGRFVEVNCATIRGEQAMSALFGHSKGAFTGAVTDRDGLLKAAHGGLLFLDEVAELGADEQAMLLRAVEERTFLPLGSDRESASDFQLICGANRDLRHEAASGRFRADLLARIDLWVFRLPGLAQRREDIEPNVRYELDRFAERTGTRVTFNKEAWRLFMEFALSALAPWTANFRDLAGAVTRMATLAPGGRITADGARMEVERLMEQWQGSGGQGGHVERLLGIGAGELDLFDRAQLETALAVCAESGSISEAGRRLFNVSREKKKAANDADRLIKYLKRFGLSWRRINDELGREGGRQ